MTLAGRIRVLSRNAALVRAGLGWVLFLAMACKGSGEPAPASTSVASVSLRPASIVMDIGTTRSLTATVMPADATDKNLMWTSTDPMVASVSASGVLLGLKAGSTNVIARSMDGSEILSNVCAVTVYAPRDYLADLKGHLVTYRPSIASAIATGDINTMAEVGYYLYGMAFAAEATGDTELLDELVAGIELMMAKAQPLVRNGVTYQEWGPWDVNGNPPQLYTFLGTGPLAKTAAVIAGRQAFKEAYGDKLDAIVAYVDQSIFDYWFDKNAGVYADPSSQWLGGKIPWVSSELGGWGSYDYWDNKGTHLGLMATWMYQATKDPLYLEYATRVAQGFKAHLVDVKGHWMWDEGKWFWDITPGVGNAEGSPDTSHANREAMMISAMYEAGIEFTASDVEKMARTLLDVIWNQSESDPMFTNYINGSNKAYRTYTEAGRNGVIYQGWSTLGRRSAEVRRLMNICDQIVRNAAPEDALNVSLQYNDTSYARVELPGILIWNAAAP